MKCSQLKTSPEGAVRVPLPEGSKIPTYGVFRGSILDV